MEGEYGMYRRYEEFQETDVWSVLTERNEFKSDFVKSKESSASSIPTAARMIPKRSTKNPDVESRIRQRQSAPVTIPDWSKIYGKSKRSSQNSTWFDYGYNDDNDNNDYNGKESWDSDYDDDDDGNIMPPHEWIAQKLARSQISSFSVCEGAGRTLKGRDLSRVRNTVLSRTGFLE